MRARRARLEIYIDLLDVISNGEAVPTRIMHGANLSWGIFQFMIEDLAQQGLVMKEIEQNDNRINHTYQITDKGKETLENFMKAKPVLEVK